jgi:hypothetical protein
MNIEDRNLSGTGDELAWRALRYLHGELTADEAEAFEEDLAVEQPAREALAQAVELTATLEAAALEPAGDVGGPPSEYAATRRPAPTEPTFGAVWRRRLSRPQVLLGAGIAACLAVVVTLGLTGHLGRHDPDDRGPPDPGNAQAALAEAWAGIGGDVWHDIVLHDAALHEAALHDVAPPVPMAFFPDGDGADHEAELSVPSVPSWMLAALDPQPDETPEIEEIKEIKQ